MSGVYQLVEEKGVSFSRAITLMKIAFIKGKVSEDDLDPEAGIKYVDGKPNKLSHPFYWAPFVYYGVN